MMILVLDPQGGYQDSVCVFKAPAAQKNSMRGCCCFWNAAL